MLINRHLPIYCIAFILIGKIIVWLLYVGGQMNVNFMTKYGGRPGRVLIGPVKIDILYLTSTYWHQSTSLDRMKFTNFNGSYLNTLLKGQFTPRIKSIRYIWDMESNNYY